MHRLSRMEGWDWDGMRSLQSTMTMNLLEICLTQHITEGYFKTFAQNSQTLPTSSLPSSFPSNQPKLSQANFLSAQHSSGIIKIEFLPLSTNQNLSTWKSSFVFKLLFLSFFFFGRSLSILGYYYIIISHFKNMVCKKRKTDRWLRRKDVHSLTNIFTSSSSISCFPLFFFSSPSPSPSPSPSSTSKPEVLLTHSFLPIASELTSFSLPKLYNLHHHYQKLTMLLKALTTVAVAAGTVMAQRPTNTSVCDYYTTALLVNNTAENQKTLLTLVVNTAIIGNCMLLLSLIPT